MNKLKSCPFCNKYARIIKLDTGYYIECSLYGCCTFGLISKKGNFKSIEEAKTLWNDRDRIDVM